jgi:hypothetical protein
MSYNTINTAAHDQALLGRVAAAAAAEGADSPTGAASQLIWLVAAASDIEAAYASALAAGNPDPGGDEAVITDGMILSAVQANMPAGTAATSRGKKT